MTASSVDAADRAQVCLFDGRTMVAPKQARSPMEQTHPPKGSLD